MATERTEKAHSRPLDQGPETDEKTPESRGPEMADNEVVNVAIAEALKERPDRNRLAPTYTSLGDDSVPCRWWHPDMGAGCARCGSERPDLHDGVWDYSGTYPNYECHPRLWTDVQRWMYGMPVPAVTVSRWLSALRSIANSRPTETWGLDLRDAAKEAVNGG